jgi:hypothetical protein
MKPHYKGPYIVGAIWGCTSFSFSSEFIMNVSERNCEPFRGIWVHLNFCVVWRFVVADHFVVFSSICITTTQRNMRSRSMIKLTFRNISDCFLQRCVQYTPLSWHLRIFSNDIYKDWNLRKCSVSLEGAMNVIKGMQSIEI